VKPEKGYTYYDACTLRYLRTQDAGAIIARKLSLLNLFYHKVHEGDTKDTKKYHFDLINLSISLPWVIKNYSFG
jgi:hypothetical protein